MIVERLQLKNYIVYKDIDLSLGEIGLVSVVGRWATDTKRSNGSGKSALLEAVPYALYGVVRSKSRSDIIGKFGDSAVVVLTIRVNGHKLIIRRTCSRKANSVLLYVDGKNISSHVRIVDDTIKQYVGIDYDLFNLIYFFRQNQQFGFVNASPAERKSYLSTIFDMTVCDKCGALVKEFQDDCERNISSCIGSIDTLERLVVDCGTVDQIENRIMQFRDLYTYECIQMEAADLHQSDITDAIAYFREMRRVVLSISEITEEELNKLKLELSALNNSIAEAQITAQRTQPTLDSTKREYDKIVNVINSVRNVPDEKSLRLTKNSLVENIRSTQLKIAEFQAQINNCEKFNKSIKSMEGSNCITCGQQVTPEHAQVISNNNDSCIHVAKTNVSSFKSVLRNYESALQDADHQLSIRQNYNQVAGRDDQLKETIRSLSKVVRDNRSKVTKLSVRRSELCAEISKLSSGNMANEIGNIISTIDEKIKHISSVQGSKFNPGKYLPEIGAQEEKLKKRKLLTTEIEGLRDKLKKLTSLKSNYDILRAIFGRNGIQAIMIENIVHTIEAFANDALVRMHTPFTVEFRTQKKIQSGENRETLDIIVYDNGNERSFETYSGGERVLLNLAIRLSLSRVVSSVHGIEVGSVFLDEVLAALDEVNQDVAIKVISYLSKSFSQVFVISHTDRVKDIIPKHINIIRSDAGSIIEV